MSWNLDPSHSSVDFSVRHLGFSTVRGRFGSFDLDVTTDDAGVPTFIKSNIDASTITTGSPDRDAHLRSADFFDTDNHPYITFESTAINRDGDDLEIVGNLTIRGTTHPVTFEAEVTGPVNDPWGNPRLATEAKGKINRTKWGLTWNQILEAGGLMVSEEVKFSINAQVVGQQGAPAAQAEAAAD
jgi:polyisoprenoid-binding protein YceI